MIVPENDIVNPAEERADGNMDVEKAPLPPSGQCETKVAPAAAVSEAEGSSDSGSDLFPTANNQDATESIWPVPPDREEVMPALEPADDSAIVPFDSTHSAIADCYANRLANEAITPPATEEAVETVTVRTKRKRATGLGNLGNTCFMNSSLQCLAHTAPLREYFLSGEYKRDLNKDNPLGTGGELATEFADLLVEMWCMKQERPVNADTTGVVSSSRIYSPGNFDSGLSSVTYPRQFKHTLGKHAQQFVGYDQHDSQELAIYLLDALHEDTNRISKKPYIEKPEQEEDESDRDAAEKAWGVHLQREDSKVFDYFMGQIKSRLQCTTKGCGRVSTTFDPSMYLSVPIPGSTDREMKVTFVPLDRTQTCAEFTVKLCKNSTFAGLKKHIADLASECYNFKEGELLEEDIQITDFWNDKTFAYHADDAHIDKVKNSDITYAYQLYPLASVKKVFAAYQEAQKKSAEADPPAIEKENTPDFLLDQDSRSKLDEGDAWQQSLERYIQSAYLLTRFFRRNRSSAKDRAEFYTKLTRFVAKCRKCPDCKLSDDDIMEEKSDKAEHVSSHNPNDAESSDSPTSLAEVCQMSHEYRNVTSARDVGVLEYCAFKFKAWMHEVEQSSKNVEMNENGLIFDIGLHKDGKRVGKPIVVRVPSTLTVHELRGVLAAQLSGILKSEDVAAGHSTRETSIDGMTPQVSIMNQTALTYDSLRATFSSAFGSITEQLVNDGSPSFAKYTEDEEKELVASVAKLDMENTLLLKFPSRLNNYINEDFIMPQEWLSESQKIEKEKIQDNKVSVLDCISKFCQAEQLDENDMWYCNKCKQHNQAWKECHLYRTPPILVVHLKRFHYSATTHRRDKIDTFIDFPLNDLDLREIVTEWKEGEEPIYDCYAVSNHFGGLGGGHYTAYARGDDGTWSNFDDSRVTSSVPESEVVSNAAYCLYYKRKDVVFESGKECEEAREAQAIQSDVAMVIGSPEPKPEPILDDASSQAQMDVDDRSSNLSYGWGNDNDEMDTPPHDSCSNENPGPGQPGFLLQ
jgi:ubiquitin carboxyl-terminal hydrolase 4/11/15